MKIGLISKFRSNRRHKFTLELALSPQDLGLPANVLAFKRAADALKEIAFCSISSGVTVEDGRCCGQHRILIHNIPLILDKNRRERR